MKLDRSKKYEGLGLTWEFNRAMNRWVGYREAYLTVDAGGDIVQEWLDAGHIKPVKPTKTVRVEGFRLAMGRDGVPFVRGWDSFMDNHLVRESAETKPVTLEFEVEVDE